MVLRITGAFLLLFGAILVLVGVLLWKKQKLEWVSVHSRVRKADVPAFTRAVGRSLAGVGLAVGAGGICWMLRLLAAGSVLFGVLFVLSMFFYFRAQKRYN